ncbi:hypothetical protein HF086_006555 [Spodoptera exigua]|uniref:Uncharacterized protein n=1 Tax=Spodoptera exigua TaxID=7107 RepID=A0A922MWX8_SPOEX|nr:hypothetical protein HF086_006555 [Spodoptera exigua]
MEGNGIPPTNSSYAEIRIGGRSATPSGEQMSYSTRNLRRNFMVLLPGKGTALRQTSATKTLTDKPYNGNDLNTDISAKMDLHKQVRVLVLILPIVVGQVRKPESYVVGEEIINRVWNDMNEYVETQPYWDAATLLVTMGRAKHEMLLFADQGAAGRFTGVANVVRDGNILPARNAVPLLKFHLKLLHGGKYLLMTDCQIGVTSMSARTRAMPYRAEIGGVVSNLNFGEGYHACLSDRNKDEQTGDNK